MFLFRFPPGSPSEVSSSKELLLHLPPQAGGRGLQAVPQRPLHELRGRRDTSLIGVTTLLEFYPRSVATLHVRGQAFVAVAVGSGVLEA